MEGCLCRLKQDVTYARMDCELCKAHCTTRSGIVLGNLYAMPGVRRNVWNMTYARPFAQQSPGIGLECEEWKGVCVGSDRV